MTDRPIVVGLGELLWDCFPETRRAGGAPANFAFHARQLGLDAFVCTRVGTDPLGDELIRFLEQHGLSTAYVQRDAEHETGRVDITFSPGGDPDYDFLADSAWDFLAFDQATEQLARSASAVCFGTLAQRCRESRETIHRFLGATKPDCLRVFDVNLRPPWFNEEFVRRSLESASVLKLNGDEVEQLAKMLGCPTRDVRGFAQFVREQYDVGTMLMTRGANGCLLVRDGEAVEQPGVPVREPHPVGAGDAFGAAAVYALLQGWDLTRTAALANRVAAMVASHEGAMPDLRDELRDIVGRTS